MATPGPDVTEHDDHHDHERRHHGDHGHDGGNDHDGHGHDGGDDHDGHGHHHHAHDLEKLGVAVVTVSTTRSFDDDPSGEAIAGALEQAGHEVTTREVVNDDYDGVQGTVDRLSDRNDVDMVVTTGGTGVTPDDVTVEAVEPLFDKSLPGFGELFRRLSYEEIGTRVVATRATGGVVETTPVFCLPGSPDAVQLGIEEVVLPEVGHLAGLARRGDE